MPYCHVIADTNHMLIEGVFCKDYLVIPSDDIVLFISLIDFTVKEKVKPSYYVSDLLSANDVVYIFDCDGIIAINSDLEILWENHSLAIDGTKFVGFASDDIMEISCDMDPPGGWVDKRISIRDGALRN